MQILSINNTDYKRQAFSKQIINFRASGMQIAKTGMLKSKTSYMIQDFLRGYNEVREILSRKTSEGLNKIAQCYPNVTLGENLVFHNCGEDKNSISIRTAESEKYRGLTYIARRQGNTEGTRKVILNSFMIEGRDKLVRNFKPNYSKFFPKQKEYFLQDEIENQNLEESLQKLLSDLEPELLNFRKFLAKNKDTDLKLPDGKINYNIAHRLKEVLKIFDNIQKQGERISKKRLDAINKDFEDYKPVSGLESYTFQKLGNEKVSIYFTDLEDKNGFNLKRLYVLDQNNKPLKTFLIVDNEKFVTNLNQNNPNTLPEKFKFANTEELEKNYLPEFEKYFSLYTDKLKEYQSYLNQTIDNHFKEKICGEFDLNIASLLSESLDWYKIAKIKLRKLPPPLAKSIKQKVENLEPASGRTGLWLKDAEKNKLIQLLPLNNKEHDNLIRINVTDLKTSQKKEFLIHDFKHIIKNYNPQYPTIIPKLLKFASEKEIEESELESTFRFLRRKCEELAVKADEAFEKREELLKLQENKKKTKIEMQQQRKEEKLLKQKKREALITYKNLAKKCKQEFDKAISSIDFDIENFNLTLKNIQEQMTEFYNTHKK